MAELELNQWAEEVGADLRRIRRLLRQRFAADLAQADLTAPEVGLLSLLAAEDGQALSVVTAARTSLAVAPGRAER